MAYAAQIPCCIRCDKCFGLSKQSFSVCDAPIRRQRRAAKVRACGVDPICNRAPHSHRTIAYFAAKQICFLGIVFVEEQSAHADCPLLQIRASGYRLIFRNFNQLLVFASCNGLSKPICQIVY